MAEKGCNPADRRPHPMCEGPLAPLLDVPEAAGEEVGAGDEVAVFQGLFDGGLIGLGGGFHGEPLFRERGFVGDGDGRGFAGGEEVIGKLEAGGLREEAGEQRDEGGLQRISAGGFGGSQGGEALGLGLVVGGLSAEAIDHPAGGIRFLVEGLAVGFLGGEGFFQIGYGLDVIRFITGMEAIGELDDPAGFGCKLDAQLPERRRAGGWSCGRCKRKGDSHGIEGVKGGEIGEPAGLSAPDLGDFEGDGGAGLELLGLGQEGGGALSAGEGDHRHGGWHGQGLGSGQLNGAAQHLGIADRAGGHAIAGPLGGDFLCGPAELGSGGGDGLIRPASTTMQEAMHQPASGLGLQGSGDAQRRPIEAAATTGNDDQRAEH